jgi:hypothetical protein
LVFIDPDNGLECASVRAWDRLGPKYACLDEVAPLTGRGQSVIIYHHTSRQGTAQAQAVAKLRLLQKANPQSIPFALLFRRGSSRAFLVIPAARHQDVLLRRVQSMLKSNWSQHFTLISLD